MKLLLAVVAVVALSACIGTVGYSNDGIAITQFAIEPSQVESGELFTVTMIYENVGERTAEDV